MPRSETNRLNKNTARRVARHKTKVAQPNPMP
nr:MAG TPA_asm: hypothetical protein [Caudoviricetes sp.]